VARTKNFLQGHTRDQFHDDATVLRIRVIKGVVNGNDRGVRQSAGRPDFTHEHLLRAVGSFLRTIDEGENLQGHLAAEGWVGSFVNDPHGSPAQLGNDGVSSDLLHGSSSRWSGEFSADTQGCPVERFATLQ
jgi:hypothetical protein